MIALTLFRPHIQRARACARLFSRVANLTLRRCCAINLQSGVRVICNTHRKMGCTAAANNDTTTVAVAFYGDFRATPFTIASLEKNLISPLTDMTPMVDVFVHAMLVSPLTPVDQRHAEKKHNQRGRSLSSLDPFAFLRLNATRRLCLAEAEQQAVVDDDENILPRSRSQSDDPVNRHLRRYHHYSAISFANILRATYSLLAASKLIRAREAEARFLYSYVAFARPDARPQRPFRWNDLPFRTRGDTLLVPNNQHHGGLNDRFVFGTRDAALRLATQYAHERKPGLQFGGKNAEQRRLAHVRRCCANVTVAFTPLCLVRVRANGNVVQNDLRVAYDNLRAGKLRVLRRRVDPEC